MNCCSSGSNDNFDSNAGEEEVVTENGEGTAQVTDVSVSESENGHTFSVTILSNDTDCKQYADWWEVIDLNGNLIHRRILGHSHVDEQPFTRSGGPFPLDVNTTAYVRAHMNNNGYGTKVFKGSINDGFTADNLNADFEKDLAESAPLPSGCAL